MAKTIFSTEITRPDDDGIMKGKPILPVKIDVKFAELAIEYLETGDIEILKRIARTHAAVFLAAHSRRISFSGDEPDIESLVEQLLSSSSMNDVSPDEVRSRLQMVKNDFNAWDRSISEAADYLPSGALLETVLYLTIGYDIGVALANEASINLAHAHFAANPCEMWFYIVHELHHSGFQKYHPLPMLRNIRTTRDLVDLIRYLTTLEGLAVHAARKWREDAEAMQADSDYLALLDEQRMASYEQDFFCLFNDLAKAEPRSLEDGDWSILERMSSGNRLWYRVGALMANRIEEELGRDAIVDTVLQGPAAFFDRYFELADKY